MAGAERCLSAVDALDLSPPPAVCVQVKTFVDVEGKHDFVCRFLAFIFQFEPKEM